MHHENCMYCASGEAMEHNPEPCDHCNATIVEDWRTYDEICATCGAEVRKVVERHATYYEDKEGDSLRYVPQLHDHRP